MAGRIIQILRSDPGSSHFFAFGVGHFLGQHSIVTLVREAGLQVERVEVEQEEEEVEEMDGEVEEEEVEEELEEVEEEGELEVEEEELLEEETDFQTWRQFSGGERSASGIIIILCLNLITTILL